MVRLVLFIGDRMLVLCHIAEDETSTFPDWSFMLKGQCPWVNG
jgi:hypothetical protein